MPATRAHFPIRYLGLPLSIWQLKRADFQFLEDKVAARLVPWDGQNVTTTGRGSLVKSVLTSPVIYHATPLIIPPPVIKSMNKIERTFLWARTEKIIGAKCKVNWATVCRPKHLGGFGVLDLDKFARALRLRWLWYEWKDPDKLWVGMGNPCDKVDINLFYAYTIISMAPLPNEMMV